MITIIIIIIIIIIINFEIFRRAREIITIAITSFYEKPPASQLRYMIIRQIEWTDHSLAFAKIRMLSERVDDGRCCIAHSSYWLLVC
jgi:hypothetical protein